MKHTITHRRTDDFHSPVELRSLHTDPLPDKETPESCRARIKGIMKCIKGRC